MKSAFFTSAPAESSQPPSYAEAIKEEIQSLLSAAELETVPVKELVDLPREKLLGFCQTVKEWRHEYKAGELDFSCPNTFLANIHALERRGIPLKNFLALSLAKQIALATESFSYRLFDIGVNFEKFFQLEAEDIEQVFSWIKQDDSKLFCFLTEGGSKKLAAEVNEHIENLLDDPLPPLSMS